MSNNILDVMVLNTKYRNEIERFKKRGLSGKLKGKDIEFLKTYMQEIEIGNSSFTYSIKKDNLVMEKGTDDCEFEMVMGCMNACVYERDGFYSIDADTSWTDWDVSYE